MDLTTKTASFPRRRCGVLGCTGSVGQRFSLLLAQHPHFELVAVGASERSKGKTYREAVNWKQTTSMPAKIGDLVVTECKPQYFPDCDLVFSGLDSSVAGDVEMEFYLADIPVFSNAKNHRQVSGIPLVVPTVNLSHLDLIPAQRQPGRERGFIVCNSNCAVIGIVIPLAAIQAKCGLVNQINVFTLQAISGAGYPGVPSSDIIDNIIPYISGEEEKIQPEARKILGSVNVEREDLEVSAKCTRVPVQDGHVAVVQMRFADRDNVPTVEAVKHALENYISQAQSLECPSAPEKAITLMTERDRPQPRLDRDADRGYSVSVGQVEKESGMFDMRFTALSHNTIIGAAGSSILNAEAAVIKGFV